MTELPNFTPRQIDPGKPTSARLYDWYLGGDHNFAVDQAMGAREIEVCPWARTLAHDNRDFLRRAVRYLANEGITQFLDIGCGIPTAGNTHEIAHAVNPSARVVYVDKDLEAVTTARALLRDEPRVAVIDADLRSPDTILAHPALALLDFSRPVGLLMVSVLPFIANEHRPHEIVARFVERLVPGSYLALSHVTTDDVPEAHLRQIERAVRAYDDTADPATIRSRQEFQQFLAGLTLVPPGICYAAEWRPDGEVDLESPARPFNYAAVGRVSGDDHEIRKAVP